MYHRRYYVSIIFYQQYLLNRVHLMFKIQILTLNWLLRLTKILIYYRYFQYFSKFYLVIAVNSFNLSLLTTNFDQFHQQYSQNRVHIMLKIQISTLNWSLHLAKIPFYHRRSQYFSQFYLATAVYSCNLSFLIINFDQYYQQHSQNRVHTTFKTQILTCVIIKMKLQVHFFILKILLLSKISRWFQLCILKKKFDIYFNSL